MCSYQSKNSWNGRSKSDKEDFRTNKTTRDTDGQRRIKSTKKTQQSQLCAPNNRAAKSTKHKLQTGKSSNPTGALAGAPVRARSALATTQGPTGQKPSKDAQELGSTFHTRAPSPAGHPCFPRAQGACTETDHGLGPDKHGHMCNRQDHKICSLTTVQPKQKSGTGRYWKTSECLEPAQHVVKPAGQRSLKGNVKVHGTEPR